MQAQSTRLLAITLLSSAIAMPALSANVDSAINQGVKRTDKAQVSQKRIDNIDDQTRSIEAQYRAVSQENEGLEVYIQQLDTQLNSQQQELNNIEESLKQVTLIERQMMPLMLKMIESIDLFVKADVPFQKDMRLARVDTLKDLMGRSDVSMAEKYRKVLDAYQKEMNYGRTIKSYRGELAMGDSAKEVDFLRVGRIALIYQTLDGKEMGVWDKESKSYKNLDASYKSKISMALRIAREQAAPGLIKIPVDAPLAQVVTGENG